MGNKKLTIIGIIVVLLVVIGAISLKFVLNKDLEKQKEDLNETVEKYGSVEKETIQNIVAKFNALVVDNSSLNPASEDYLTKEEDNTYWYGLEQGLYLMFEPVEYKGDKTKEVTEYMLLYIDNTYTDENKVLEYAKYLIKANNNEITDDEASKLVSDAKSLADSKKTANNAKGISVGFFKGEAHTEIQVMRLYK